MPWYTEIIWSVRPSACSCLMIGLKLSALVICRVIWRLKKSEPVSPISVILSLFHTLPRAFCRITALVQRSKEPLANGRILTSKMIGMSAYSFQRYIGRKYKNLWVRKKFGKNRSPDYWKFRSKSSNDHKKNVGNFKSFNPGRNLVLKTFSHYNIEKHEIVIIQGHGAPLFYFRC